MPRPRVAAFCHSLERNGANNFLLYLVRELREQLSFEVVSPKEGAMRADYEAMGVPVSICNMKLVSYPQDVRVVLQKFQYAIANTIMTTEVINASRDLNVPCLWVIHEAWPKDQFNYYAKEVFMMTHLDEKAIVDAFTNASKIVFPANVQRRCYDGLFEPENARVIYNGIPLASINAFRAVQSRDKVRKELGYGPDDMLLVHMGTVCKRKAQLVTCQAFAELYMNGPLPDGKTFKLLMVGARYIRQHEIEYIEECKQTLEAAGAEGAATILDVKKNVLPFYLAADIILCPSINEVLPLVICEGMAFERPVIATRIDGIPEALDNDVEGLLIEPNNPMALYDAIEKLATNEELRNQMGTAGRKRVLSQFSFATMSKTYRETIGKDLEIVPNGNVVDVKV
ncbi:D-inositol-3-phosphate glycosyltransferase [Gracilaria domingensis]|nr:D-inositol-3-phosphate glycosyltransferase [Gracilaria domingensis]